MPEVACSEIIDGIKDGIVPEKPGALFNFFKKQLEKVDEDIEEFGRISQERHELDRAGYLVSQPPGGERELAYELGERYIRLFYIACRYMDSIVPGEEHEKYRRPL